MSNENDILKRILLNMKYNSSMTFEENKVILEQIKKPKISIGSLEKLEQGQDVTYKDAIGGELILPNTAKITRYISKDTYVPGINNLNYIQSSFPIFTQMCKANGVKDINKCLNDGFTHWVNLLTDDFGVGGFNIDGKTYTACFLKKRNEKLVLPTETSFSGYYTGEPKTVGDCGKEKWVYTGIDKQLDDKEPNKSGSSQDVIGSEGGLEGGFGEVYIALDLDL